MSVLSHLVGQQDAGDGPSVGQHGLLVQVLFPIATAEETGRVGDVKYNHTAQCSFIIDPGHGNEALLTCATQRSLSHHLLLNLRHIIHSRNNSDASVDGKWSSLEAVRNQETATLFFVWSSLEEAL